MSHRSATDNLSTLTAVRRNRTSGVLPHDKTTSLSTSSVPAAFSSRMVTRPWCRVETGRRPRTSVMLRMPGGRGLACMYSFGVLV